MIHGIKLAMSKHGERTIIGSDDRVREADKVLTQLQRWFPQLQALVDENERTWTSLGYNMCSVAKTAQEVYGDEHNIHYMLHALYTAGDTIVSPMGCTGLLEERKIAAGELRTFNENIRQLRLLQTDCVAALKNRAYYMSKLESMRENDGKKKNKKITDKDTDRRVRNEQKLADFCNQAQYQVDKLRRELETVVSRKEIVTGLVLSSYVRTQDFFLGRNPMPPVLSLLAAHMSPRSVSGHGQAYDVGVEMNRKSSIEKKSNYISPLMTSSLPSNHANHILSRPNMNTQRSFETVPTFVAEGMEDMTRNDINDIPYGGDIYVSSGMRKTGSDSDIGMGHGMNLQSNGSGNYRRSRNGSDYTSYEAQIRVRRDPSGGNGMNMNGFGSCHQHLSNYGLYPEPSN